MTRERGSLSFLEHFILPQSKSPGRREYINTQTNLAANYQYGQIAVA